MRMNKSAAQQQSATGPVSANEASPA